MKQAFYICLVTLLFTFSLQAQNDLILTGVFDATLTGGQPKGVELFVVNDIPDLSIYALGSANNGQGTDGEEWFFPAESATAGSYITVTADSLAFVNFFGVPPTYVDSDDGSVNINGDDAIELFQNGTVVDVFGDINVDGSGQPWEYQDGWAYRVDGTGPDGNTFVQSNWTFSGVDGLEGGSNNAGADVPFPINTYMQTPPSDVTAGDDNVGTDTNTDVTFNVLNNDVLPIGDNVTIAVLEDVQNGTLTDNGNGSFTYSPDMDFCGTDGFTYEVCDTDVPSCDTAMVSITVECPVSYPAYDIATVTTVDATGQPDSIGISCQLQGIVYGVDLQGTDLLLFTVRDATGGIAVFSVNNFGYTVNEGDELIMQGTIDEFSCLTQMEPDTLWVVSTNNPLDAPTLVADPLTEAEESELIRIENLTLVDPNDWTGSGTGFDVEVTDGVNTYSMRIDDQVDLYSLPAPTGIFNATGIGGQFDNQGDCDEGYQFLPRYMEDIDPVGSTQFIDLDGLVTVSPNPTTDLINIQTELAIERLEVRDLLGRPVLALEQPANTLDLSDLPQGVYVLTLVVQGGSWSTQIMKQ
jgi:hypothetical protein